MSDDQTWRMWALDTSWGLAYVHPFRQFPLAYRRDQPIVRVEVRIVADDDPAATHWGWMRNGEDAPSMIWTNQGAYEMCFPYGPVAEEKVGHGRTVRLTVQVVDEDCQQQ